MAVGRQGGEVVVGGWVVVGFGIGDFEGLCGRSVSPSVGLRSRARLHVTEHELFEPS